METDGRFVQNVQDSPQPRSHLGGQTETAGLPSGKGRGCPPQLQVAHPQLLHDQEPGADFLQDRGGDPFLRGGKLQTGNFIRQSVDRKVGQIKYVPVPHFNGKAFFSKAAPSTGCTEIVCQHDLPPLILGGLVANSVTPRAGPVRAVEGKRTGFQLGQIDGTIGAQETQRIIRFAAIGFQGQQVPVRHFQSSFYGFDQSRPRGWGNENFIDQNFDVVFFHPLQIDSPAQLHQLSVNPGAEESFAEQPFEKPMIFPFSSFDHR